MNIREEIQRRSGLVSALAGVAIVLAVVIWFLTRDASPVNQSRADSVKAWYTIDDGATFFPESQNKAPPFEYKGKTAYRCQVWSCDGGVTKIVTRLERYRPEEKKALDEAYERIRRGEAKDDRAVAGLENTFECKAAKTGEAGQWHDSRSAVAGEMMVPKCPDPTRLKRILPE
jgi:hypothetical protein